MRAAVTAALLLLTATTVAQTKTFYRDWAYAQYGDNVLLVRDMDNDGTRDFLLGSGHSPLPKNKGQEVRLISGEGFTTIHAFAPPGLPRNPEFGARLAYEDVNGDDRPDFLISAQHFSDTAGQQAGALFAFDGKPPYKQLWMIKGGPGERLGEDVLLMDYWPLGLRDGKKDLLVSGIGNDLPNIAHGGVVRVYTLGNSSPKLVKSYTLGGSRDGFGKSLVNLGDVIGNNGLADLGVGMYGGYKNGNGSIIVYEGLFGVRHTWLTGTALGSDIELADLDNDKTPELLVGQDGYNTYAGVAIYKQQRTGPPKIVETLAANGDRRYGFHIQVLGDIDKDGLPDFAVGGEDRVDIWSSKKDRTKARILIGRVSSTGTIASFQYANDELWVGNHAYPMSLVHYTTQRPNLTLGNSHYWRNFNGPKDITVTLSAGKQHAGKVYLIVVGMSGKTPGVPLAPNVHMYLNPDFFTMLALGAVNVPPFVNFLGVLDLNGDATPKPVWQHLPLLSVLPANATIEFSAVGIGKDFTWDLATDTRSIVVQ